MVAWFSAPSVSPQQETATAYMHTWLPHSLSARNQARRAHVTPEACSANIQHGGPLMSQMGWLRPFEKGLAPGH